MNTDLIVLIVVVSWSLLSIIVALAVGGMARARDVGATPLLDHTLAPGRMAPPARTQGPPDDERFRTAV